MRAPERDLDLRGRVVGGKHPLRYLSIGQQITAWHTHTNGLPTDIGVGCSMVYQL